MSNEMENFKLTLELLTPVILPRNPICLDSVLAGLVSMRFEDFEDVKTQMKRLLKQTDGVYHASSLIFGTTEDVSIKVAEASVVRLTRDETDLDPKRFAPTLSKGRYKKVKTTTGRDKNRIIQERALYSPCLVFYGVGDIAKVLQYFQLCVFGIGRNSNRLGSGNLGRIRIERIEEDMSLVDSQGCPNRPLPLSLFQSLSDRTVAVKPVRTSFPYYDDKHEQEGVSPTAVRTELQNNLEMTLAK